MVDGTRARAVDGVGKGSEVVGFGVMLDVETTGLTDLQAVG